MTQFPDLPSDDLGLEIGERLHELASIIAVNPDPDRSLAAVLGSLVAEVHEINDLAVAQLDKWPAQKDLRLVRRSAE
jgi:hypothetical protein